MKHYYTEEKLRKLIRIHKNWLSEYDLTNIISNRYNYHAGWEVGFCRGRLDIYENLLMDIEEGKKCNTK